MHVVLLKPQLKLKGGLEKHAHRIANSFAAMGAKVTWLTTALPEQKDARMQYLSIPVARWPGFLRLEQFDRRSAAVVKTLGAEIVLGLDKTREQTHIRAGGGVHAAYLLSRGFSEGAFKQWTCQINPLHRKILQIEKDAFESPRLKKIFTNSHKVKQEILFHYSVDATKIEVIHNGVEWEELDSAFAATETVKRIEQIRRGLQPDRFQILFIGHGYKRKGLDRLLEALSLWKFRDFDLSVVGHDKNIAAYRAKAIQLKLDSHVHWFGEQKKTEPFYQVADILAIPSFYDPFANVTLEALSLGVFVVSSTANGASEILTLDNGVCIGDLLSSESFLFALEKSLSFRKTAKSASKIRASVSHLDFSSQLTKFIHACL